MLLTNSINASLGLSPNEAKIYESLVENGEQSISQIAIHAKIHRRNAYDAIHRLLNKGLIFQIIDPRENHYNAVDPDKLKELLSERAQELSLVLPALHNQYHKQNIPEAAYIFKGYEGHKAIWREMLTTGKDVHGIGAKAQWFDPHLTHSREAFYKEANRKKMSFHFLFDAEVATKMPSFAENYPAKAEYKFLPAKYSTDSATYVFGDYLVMYTGIQVGQMSDNVTFFVLKSPGLAESFRKWFGYMWDLSKSSNGTSKLFSKKT